MVKATPEPQTPQIPVLPSALGLCSAFVVREPPQGGGAILFFFIVLRIRLSTGNSASLALSDILSTHVKRENCGPQLAAHVRFRRTYRVFALRICTDFCACALVRRHRSPRRRRHVDIRQSADQAAAGALRLYPDATMA